MGTFGKKLKGSILWGSYFSRNLIIISILIVILLPSYNVAFVYPSLTHLFNEIMTREATNIAKHFRSMFETRTGELTGMALDTQTKGDIDKLREDFGLAKMKIFSPSGEILFSTDPKEVGDINTERYYQEIVARGAVYTKVVKKDSDTLEHEKMSVDVVEAYVPLVKDGVFVGAFEIYYDITEERKNLQSLLITSFVIVILLALSVLVLSVMIFIKEKRRLIERKRAEDEREKLIVELQEALAEVRTLTGLLPICASCKKIRDDQGYWNQIEDYISRHSKATFSHGLCPECAKKLYPEFYKEE